MSVSLEKSLYVRNQVLEALRNQADAQVLSQTVSGLRVRVRLPNSSHRAVVDSVLNHVWNQVRR